MLTESKRRHGCATSIRSPSACRASVAARARCRCPLAPRHTRGRSAAADFGLLGRLVELGLRRFGLLLHGASLSASWSIYNASRTGCRGANACKLSARAAAATFHACASRVPAQRRCAFRVVLIAGFSTTTREHAPVHVEIFLRHSRSGEAPLERFAAAPTIELVGGQSIGNSNARAPPMRRSLSAPPMSPRQRTCASRISAATSRS